MSYYIDRSPINTERVSVTVGKLAASARIEREAAAFARSIAAYPLFQKKLIKFRKRACNTTEYVV